MYLADNTSAGTTGECAFHAILDFDETTCNIASANHTAANTNIIQNHDIKNKYLGTADQSALRPKCSICYLRLSFICLYHASCK